MYITFSTVLDSSYVAFLIRLSAVFLRQVQSSMVLSNRLSVRICRLIPQKSYLSLSVTSTFFFILNVRKICPTSVTPIIGDYQIIKFTTPYIKWQNVKIIIGIIAIPSYRSSPSAQPCPAQLWQLRFSAGQGTYSPYRRSAPHPVTFFQRESDNLDDAFPGFWIPA